MARHVSIDGTILQRSAHEHLLPGQRTLRTFRSDQMWCGSLLLAEPVIGTCTIGRFFSIPVRAWLNCTEKVRPGKTDALGISQASLHGSRPQLAGPLSARLSGLAHLP